ncbi:MAG TPA: hypothetical protein VGA99_09945 [bacterium]
MFKKKKKTRKVRIKAKQIAKRKVNSSLNVIDISDYLYHRKLVRGEPWQVQHPNNELWERAWIEEVCRRPLSTQAIRFLEDIYERSNDALVRGLLARKSYVLRRDYLKSFREYSDRALILLAKRENFLDKWEGIYILSSFGSERILPEIQTWLNGERNSIVRHALTRAIEKIRRRKKQKTGERGF